MSAGVPIKLLKEGEGHTVAIELKNGEIYKGRLDVSEDNMNCHMTGVSFTARDGRTSKLEHVFLRGSQIRFVVLPDMLKNAPMFKRVQQAKDNKEKSASKSGTGTRGLTLLQESVADPLAGPARNLYQQRIG